MAKKDVTTNLDIERREQDSDGSADQNKSSENELHPEKTEVKNAHATGLGAIGRSDQKEERDNQGFNNY